MKISFLILMFTEMRIQNLTLISFNQLEKLFDFSKQQSVNIPLIKSRKRDNIEIAIAYKIKKNYISGTYQLQKDFNIIKERFEKFSKQRYPNDK